MRRVLILVSGAALVLAGCTTTDPQTGQVVRNNTATNAIIGAAAGAVLGYASNNDSKQARKNAMLGAGIGALAGAGIGMYMDKQQAELRRKLAGTGVEVSRQGDNIVLNMPSDISFGVDRDSVESRFYPVLSDVARTLRDYPSTYIDVVGHADSSGQDGYNQALSERRAASVADYLVSQGIQRERLAVSGRGETQPIADNGTPEGRSRNRRVEVILRPLTQ